MSKAITSDDSCDDSNQVTFTEIEIPVPWGKIAAKACGEPSSHPILCLHGLLDNSASFDRLVQALSLKSHFFLSIDLPGHGKSSHLKPGTQYRFLDFLTVILRIKQYFHWEKFCIVGHEMGGLLGLYFAAYFPKAIDKLIVLNPVCYLARNKDQSQQFIKAADAAYEVQHQAKEITFPTLTDALKVMINLRKTKLSTELLPVLLRNINVVAKVWGAADNKPLLAVHGLQDNAGTFDRLVPFLPKHLYIVCIDLPGHGRSSHFPPGIVLHYMDYILSVRKVVDFLKWEQFYFVGHSYGAQLGAYFSAFWPERIIKLVMLDAISTFVYSDFMDRFAVNSSKLLTMESRIANKQPPAYSFEEALQRMLESRISKLTDDAAKTLIMRSLVKRNNGVGFSTDQRLKFAAWVPWGPEQNVNILQRIRRPHLIVLASQSLPILSKSFSREMKMFKSRRNFTCIVVDGNHDVHNNQPELVGPIITKFLTTDKSAL